jgi:glycosyltransferase involved in cell wall biosynthesis
MLLKKTIQKYAHTSEQTHIAFVACNRNRHRFRENPSYVYRCENLGLALESLGYRVSFVHLSAVCFTDLPDIAVFHRPCESYLLMIVLFYLRHNGVKLLTDVDDLVFNENFAEFSPGVVNNLVTIKDTQKQFLSNRRAIERFDAITVSTEPLKQHVIECFPNARVEVLPNAVHRTWRQAQHEADSMAKDATNRRFSLVTYFPGTRSHDKDFTIFAEGIGAFLAKYQDARLEVTGPLSFKLSARQGQVVQHEKLSFEHYLKQVQRGWVNLAPLADSPFTQCKSALKVLEAGYCGVPTVCTPLADAQRFLNSGALFAEDAEACFKQLETMLEKSCYQEATTGLSDRVLAAANVDFVANCYLRFIGV